MELSSKAMYVLIGANEKWVRRYNDVPPRPLDRSDFAWTAHLEDNWRAIRQELDQVRGVGVNMPQMADVFLVDQTEVSVDGEELGEGEGIWNVFPFLVPGGWIDLNCERCPVTTSFLKTIPALTFAQFSVLQPRTKIGRHHAANKGSFRYLLALDVPEPAGSCGMTVGDTTFTWSEGDAVLFDHSVEHSAWNDGDGPRVMLFLETIAPIRGPLGVVNRLIQSGYKWYPGMRGAHQRARELSEALNP